MVITGYDMQGKEKPARTTNFFKNTRPALSSGPAYFKTADKRQSLWEGIDSSLLMTRQFIVGVIGGFLGTATAIYVICVAGSPGMTLSGVLAALFSSLGLMGAAIANTETRFAGWMLLSSTVWIALSVPLARHTLSSVSVYAARIVVLGTAAVLCFMEPEEDDEPSEEGDS